MSVIRRCVSVKTDEVLADDLRTLAAAGMTQSDAVRLGVALLAQAYRAAWDEGHVPVGHRPTITGMNIAPYDAGMTGTVTG